MVTLSPRVGRLRANNPSPMTLDGTNGYVVQVAPRTLVAIDPGPVDDAQRDAFLTAARERDATYAAILVTHGHPDHAPGAAPLAAATGAPVWAHAAARFPHDRALGDGELLAFEDAALTVVDAPGHARDHLVFHLEDEGALFTGDVVIGTGTVVVAPPGGDMRDYQRTLRMLRERYGDARALYGGHGPTSTSRTVKRASGRSSARWPTVRRRYRRWSHASTPTSTAGCGRPPGGRSWRISWRSSAKASSRPNGSSARRRPRSERSSIPISPGSTAISAPTSSAPNWATAPRKRWNATS